MILSDLTKKNSRLCPKLLQFISKLGCAVCRSRGCRAGISSGQRSSFDINYHWDILPGSCWFGQS